MGLRPHPAGYSGSLVFVGVQFALPHHKSMAAQFRHPMAVLCVWEPQIRGLADAFEPTTFAGIIIGGVAFAVGRWLKIQEAQKNMAPHEKGELPKR